MELRLERFSYLSGEALLNSKPGVKAEIEEVMLHPRMDIALLSRDQFVELSRADFRSRGWDVPVCGPAYKGGAPSLLELTKDRVGLQFGFQSTSILEDILKLQRAHGPQSAGIDVGVYVLATGPFQNRIRKQTGKSWGGPSFGEVAKKLPNIGRLVEVPLCLLGLDMVEAANLSAGENINLKTPSQIKEQVFDFLEKKYGRTIDRNFRMMGSGVDIEFDGVMRLEDRDVILELEMGDAGDIHSRFLSDTSRNFGKTLQGYQQLLGKPVALRVIFMGEFSLAYIRSQIGQSDLGAGDMVRVLVDHEMYSLEELGFSPG